MRGLAVEGSVLGKAAITARSQALDLDMFAIGLIAIFLAVLVALNIFEHGRAD